MGGGDEGGIATFTRDLRDAVALVPQKPFLFDATVRENIEMGKSPYTDSTVEEVAKASHATVFIDDFPDRFDERLGENGNRLSGGQLQRLALARAFFKNSPLNIELRVRLLMFFNDFNSRNNAFCF